MIDDALKANYLQIRALSALSPDSKAHKKAFAKLRNRTQYAMINDFRLAQPKDDAYPFKMRRKRASIGAMALILLSVAVTVLMVIFGGDSEIQTFTPEETKAFLLWTIVIFAPLALALSMVRVIQAVFSAYLLHAIDSLQVDTQDITDAELSQIIDYSDHNFDLLYEDGDPVEQCGCYSCMARFDMNELRFDHGSAVCPVCRKDTILFGYPDMPITDEILTKAKRFWG